MLTPMSRRSPAALPADLRPRLEAARLDLLALFRALDQMALTPLEIPQRLLQQERTKSAPIGRTAREAAGPRMPPATATSRGMRR